MTYASVTLFDLRRCSREYGFASLSPSAIREVGGVRRRGVVVDEDAEDFALRLNRPSLNRPALPETPGSGDMERLGFDGRVEDVSREGSSQRVALCESEGQPLADAHVARGDVAADGASAEVDGEHARDEEDVG